MNDISYSFHYRNLDSTKYYADKALNLSEDYDNGYAEALNNLAFVSIVKMNYDNAYKLLNAVLKATDNQFELLGRHSVHAFMPTSVQKQRLLYL